VRFFTCLLAPDGRRIADATRHLYESLPRERRWEFQWHSFQHVAVLTGGDDDYGDPLVIADGAYVAVGVVRLDNRADLERWSGHRDPQLSDLDLVLKAVARSGTTHLPHLLGDFAFVVWNTVTRTGVAACDAFMLQRLYYAERDGLLAFASRAEALAIGDHYDPQYLAEVVALCGQSPDLTVYAGVKAVPQATMLVLERGSISASQYWSPLAFEPDSTWVGREREAAATCRELLAESVRLRLSGGGGTWAQLSGGMDSSSVVSIAQWLVERGIVAHGLAGTVSYAFGHGTGADEREYSDVVAKQWHIRNETIVAPPIWHDDQYAPPRLDQPRFGLVTYPRDRRLCAIVRGAGGRVLLTGVGGDNLFTGSMFFFADWLAGGRIVPAARELARRAAMGRVSFWDLAWRNAMLPLLPRFLQKWLSGADAQVPPWIQPKAARKYELRKRKVLLSAYGGRVGHKYHHAAVSEVVGLGPSMDYEVIKETLDVRHPFLYRPLVEFALRLPPELCVRPHERKWVLREGMRGILPEVIRKRVGKGAPDGLYAWSLGAQRSFLEPLLREPILAELGIIDATKLRTACDEAPQQGRSRNGQHTAVQVGLAVEAWLQMRSGRWARGDNSSPVSDQKVLAQ
jgi:asparagine synthase (glutamine-hydrolysing)